MVGMAVLVLDRAGAAVDATVGEVDSRVDGVVCSGRLFPCGTTTPAIARLSIGHPYFPAGCVVYRFGTCAYSRALESSRKKSGNIQERIHKILKTKTYKISPP